MTKRSQIALAAGLMAVIVLAGCGGLQSIQVFQVYITNNLGVPVVVRDCDSYCTSSPIDLNLAPGDSTPINRVANEHKQFSITTTSGGRVGCLDLFFKAPAPGTSVPISSAMPCPGGGGPGIPWLPVLTGIALLALLLGVFRRSAARA